MKKILTTLSLLLLTIAASAQYTKSIRLWADDGTDMTFNLSRSLVIRFDEKNLIASDENQTFTISLDKVKMEYSNSPAPTGIEKTLAGQGASFENGSLVFQGLKENQPIRVYSFNGQLLRTVPAVSRNGKTVLPLSALPQGACIIQAGAYNIKYNRR